MCPQVRWRAVFTKSAVFYDAVYAAKDYAGEAERIDMLIKTHALTSGNTLLDVACGSGGHLAYLKHHYVSEGLDLDPLARDRQGATPRAALPPC